MDILVKSPVSCAADRQRNCELTKLAGDTARKIVLAFVEAGWRESEVALAFADAFDEYCLYLAQRPGIELQAANVNTATGRSAAN